MVVTKIVKFMANLFFGLEKTKGEVLQTNLTQENCVYKNVLLMLLVQLRVILRTIWRFSV